MRTSDCSRLGRLFALVVLGLMLAWGCSSSMRAESARPVDLSPVRVIQRGDVRNFVNGRLGVLIFHSPDSAPGIGAGTSTRYVEALAARNLFRSVMAIPQSATSEEGVLWQGRQQQCDLVMAGAVLLVTEGSGAMPTRLRVRVNVLDTRSGRTVWEVEQEAHSEPGKDVDLYWMTFAGENAQRVDRLERALADQMATFLLEPLLGKGKGSP